MQSLFRTSPESAQSANNPHRPPVSAHNRETITLRVDGSAKYKPSEIHWAIGHAIQRVDMSIVPWKPPKFEQVLTYDPTQRYEIWSSIRYPGTCSISIEGMPIDSDKVAQGANEEVMVHCWVDPL